MKGALAVMVELALARVAGDDRPRLRVLRPRGAGGHRERARPGCSRARRGCGPPTSCVVMEPTANAVHAGCLGNVNATWTFHGRSGHSARPWLADNAIHRAAAGIHALAQVPPDAREFDGLRFTEVVSVTRIAGGIADNVVPAEAVAHVNYRYAPGRSAERGRGVAARAVRAPRHAGHRGQRPQRPGRDRQPDGPAADRRRRPGGRAQAGVDPGRRVRRRRRRRRSTSAPATRPRPTPARSTCASTRSCAATRRSRPSRAPEPGPRRHDELPLPAPDRGQARGDRARRRRHRLRRRRAARGHAGLHPAGARAGARRRAGVDLPAGRGAARAARGDRRVGARGASARRSTPTPRSSRRRAPRRRSSTSPRSWPATATASSSPRPAIPWRRAARCSPARRWSSSRSIPRAAGSPTSTPSTGTASRCCG